MRPPIRAAAAAASQPAWPPPTTITSKVASGIGRAYWICRMRRKLSEACGGVKTIRGAESGLPSRLPDHVVVHRVELAIQLGRLLAALERLRHDIHLSRKIGTVAGGPDGETWDARADFSAPPPPPLTAWEQLAQALLLTNEFMFLD